MLSYKTELKAMTDAVTPAEKVIKKMFVQQLKPEKLKQNVIAEDIEKLIDIFPFAMSQMELFLEWQPEKDVKVVVPKHALIKDGAPRQKKCFECGGLDHVKTDCPKLNTGKRMHFTTGKPKIDADKSGADSINGNASRDIASHSNLTCHGCGVVGHIRPNCPQKARISKLDVVSDASADVSCGSIKAIIPHVEDATQPHVLATISNDAMSGQVSILLDTGATGVGNFVHPRILHQFENGLGSLKYVNHAPVEVSAATGKFEVTRSVFLDITISSGVIAPTIIPTRFLVHDVGENVVLGNTWIRDNNFLHLLDPRYSLQFDATEDDTSPPVFSQEIEYDNPELSSAVASILDKFPDIFNGDLTIPANVPPFPITLNDQVKIPRCKARRLAPTMRTEVQKQVQKLLDLKVIVASNSSTVSPIVMQKKSNGGYRLCVDYRLVNLHTKQIPLPLQDAKAVIQRLAGKKYFGRTDFEKGFHQILMAEDSIELTAFITPDGIYEWLRMPMGLTNPSGYFQRVVTDVLGKYVGQYCEVFIDDVIVYGETQEDYLHALELVLERLSVTGFKCNKSKSSFCLSQVEYLGYVCDGKGYTLSKNRRLTVEQMEPPTSVKGVLSIL
jgi:hypothetical protein